MTLSEIIAAHAARQTPTSIARTAVLTPRGHASVAARRFLRALRELDPQARAEALGEFAPELRSVIRDLAAAPVA